MSDREKFLEYCSISAGESSLKKISYKLDIIEKYFKGELKNLNLDKLHSFLGWLNNKSNYATATKHDIIKILKRFLKWKYKDWNVRFNELKDAKCNGNGDRKINKEDLLTADEMRIILTSIDSLKYKTLFLLFQETACRPEEILKVKWKEIDFNKEEIKLHSSKTDKTRFIPLKSSVEHLQRYRNECFYETPKADDRVFNMSLQAVHSYLKHFEKRIGFTKHLYPYLWRHSILSKMIRVLSPKVYEMYSGHSLETGMKTYAHLNTDDLREELKKYDKKYEAHKLTPEEKDKIKALELQIDLQKIDIDIMNESFEALFNLFKDMGMEKHHEIMDKYLKKRYEKHQELTDK